MKDCILSTTTSFLFSISLLFTILITNGCDRKKQQTSIVNSEAFSSKDKDITQKNKTNFNIKDIKNIYNISLSNDKLKIQNNNKSVVLFNIFDSNCKSCLNQIKSLKKLEKKYTETLLIITIFTNKHSNKDNNAFSQAIYERLSISDMTLPLSIIFKNTEYYSHFEDLAPIEMIRHDIQNAIQ